jgi:hypothetical protein
MPEFELEHFGVKGMRWGVRNDRESAQSLREVAARTSDPIGQATLLGKADAIDQRDRIRRERGKRMALTLIATAGVITMRNLAVAV